MIDESLDFYGIQSGHSPAELVARTRRRAALTEDEALEMAVQEVNEQRKHA